MGFETSVVIAIFFLSAMVLGTTSYATISASHDLVDDATYDQNEMQIERMHTDIEIDSYIQDGREKNFDLEITITNTGSSTLKSDELTVLVNGIVRSYTPPSIITWVPGTTKTITVLDFDDNKDTVLNVKVVAENGIYDYGTYVVTKDGDT